MEYTLAKQAIPEVPEPGTATRFVLGLDLGHLTQDEINYLHKLRTLAQRQVIEARKKRPGH